MRAPYTEGVHTEWSPTSGFAPNANRQAVAIIDLPALSHNFKEVVRRSGGRKILAVVKAQAYGHGAITVSRHLRGLGADMLGVALVEEGRELREAGIDAPVLVMGVIYPEQAEEIVRWNLTPLVTSEGGARALSRAAQEQQKEIAVHVKVDTGMGRLGIPPEETADFLERIAPLAALRIEGLMTHFADADLRNKQFASRQMDRFEHLIHELDGKRISIPVRHAANSAAVLDFDRSLFTMVRPGLILYGYNPLEERKGDADIRPVLSFVTRIAFLKKAPAGIPISYGRTFVTKRKSLIATIPVGYADGYSRALSNIGEAIVRGVRVPVAGRVCMDMTMLDVTDVPGVQEGDEVVLIGEQGQERITADDIAVKIGTIPYEVLCGISSRVPRVYQEGA